MAAPFTEQNYQDIILILRLNPDQMENGSDLRDRGLYLENQDSRLATNFVGAVQDAITGYLTAYNAKNAALEADDALGVSSQSVPGEYSVSWSGGSAGKNKYSNYDAAMRRHYQTIVQYLRWNKTSPYNGTVVSTIS